MLILKHEQLSFPFSFRLFRVTDEIFRDLINHVRPPDIRVIQSLLICRFAVLDSIDQKAQVILWAYHLIGAAFGVNTTSTGTGAMSPIPFTMCLPGLFTASTASTTTPTPFNTVPAQPFR